MAMNVQRKNNENKMDFASSKVQKKKNESENSDCFQVSLDR